VAYLQEELIDDIFTAFCNGIINGKEYFITAKNNNDLEIIDFTLNPPSLVALGKTIHTTSTRGINIAPNGKYLLT
jgi:hypothetical protein